ncbi:Uncharacterized membrane protein YfcC, ion transporter superfamily [Alteribacillus persepolensis]|uniref:Uncharacterized membrane protein YfcC, ion transporter superfamily n=1 Tax=Alteribacillus persepolensis TaxID=568899 RepID=A0A1G8AXK1_9BACI|nr:Na+/H+ antiporter NhaC family protein [Alteribacillus persepolensis]SDH25627.1 Uncharacterized membrane protein YfcC, ion transporter superfamily [Alteribacillus persepolensis]
MEAKKEKVHTEQASKQAPEKSKWKMPHVYVILVSLLLFAYVLTLVVPKGEFEREQTPDGVSMIVPESFQLTDAPNLSFFDLIFAIPTGMVQAGDLIFGGMMIGGLFAVIERTGILGIVIQYIASLFRSKRIWVIPALMVPMAVFTTITGAFEMALVYIPIVIPLVVKLGYDRFTAFAMVTIGCGAGLSVALTAPATVGVAQDIAEVPLYSGIGLRIIILAIVLLIGIGYVVRYAKKIERDPSTSYVYGDGFDAEYMQQHSTDNEQMNGRQMAGIIFLFIGMAVMVYGLLNWQWYFIEIGGWYAFMGMALGLICGLSPSQIAETFNEGFKRFVIAIVVIGLARAISVILEEGHILDTVIYGSSQLVSIVPTEITAVMMFVVQALFNFLVGSGSGQALITMPIMAGLSDLLGVTRQTTVLAFQFGDGFTNLIYPVGLIMAFLALARISYIKWLKFMMPLIGIWFVISIVSLITAQSIGW